MFPALLRALAIDSITHASYDDTSMSWKFFLSAVTRGQDSADLLG
jgi:hypothetical protein